jgi:uncharacterized protein
MRQKLIAPALCVILFFVIAFGSCSKSNDSTGGNPPPTNTQHSVLVNLGTNIILPAYQLLAAKAAELEGATTAFNNAPSATTLTDLRNKFVEAYKAWSAVSEFEFGPALDMSLTTHFTNSFPTDTSLINSNINGATYVIDGVGNYAAQGFPALDYLLYAHGDDATLAMFTTNSNAQGAKQYLAALTSSLKTKSAAVGTAWATGNYLKTFIAATGTDAGSSLSLLVNALVKDWDVNLQNFKIGIPIGLYGLNVLPKSPEKVEGYYSGLSKELLVAQVKAIQNIYTGGSGKGIDDKVAATSAQNGGMALNDAIKNQLAATLAKIQALPDPLSDGISSNASSIDEAYTEVRKSTVILKVDMTSALGIRISFQDDDGD